MQTQTSTNGDGTEPLANLVLSGNTLYGTTSGGGGFSVGTIFAVRTDGMFFTNLHSFTGLSAPVYANGTNSDGAQPFAGLILSGNILYGTAQEGGRAGAGTVFAIHTDGTGFTNLHSFASTLGDSATNSEGAHPVTGLILVSNTLYGTALDGGVAGNGAVFAVHTDGTGFTNLHSFSALSAPDI